MKLTYLVLTILTVSSFTAHASEINIQDYPLEQQSLARKVFNLSEEEIERRLETLPQAFESLKNLKDLEQKQEDLEIAKELKKINDTIEALNTLNEIEQKHKDVEADKKLKKINAAIASLKDLIKIEKRIGIRN